MTCMKIYCMHASYQCCPFLRGTFSLILISSPVIFQTYRKVLLQNNRILRSDHILSSSYNAVEFCANIIRNPYLKIFPPSEIFPQDLKGQVRFLFMDSILTHVFLFQFKSTMSWIWRTDFFLLPLLNGHWHFLTESLWDETFIDCQLYQKLEVKARRYQLNKALLELTSLVHQGLPYVPMLPINTSELTLPGPLKRDTYHV